MSPWSCGIAVPTMFAVLSLASVAAADIYEFTFTGEVETVGVFPSPPPYTGTFAGDEVIFQYTFDTDAFDHAPGNPMVGEYSMLESSITITNAGGTFTQQGLGAFTVDISPGGADYIAYTTLPGNVVFAINLFSITGQPVFLSDAPPTDIDLDAFGLETFDAFVPQQAYLFELDIIDFSSRLVPAPPALALLVLGALTARRRRSGGPPRVVDGLSSVGPKGGREIQRSAATRPIPSR